MDSSILGQSENPLIDLGLSESQDSVIDSSLSTNCSQSQSTSDSFTVEQPILVPETPVKRRQTKQLPKAPRKARKIVRLPEPVAKLVSRSIAFPGSFESAKIIEQEKQWLNNVLLLNYL